MIDGPHSAEALPRSLLSLSKGKAAPAAVPTDQRHLFVVGFFRSGTTLLYSLLNLHPQIRLVYEADILGTPLIAASSLSGRNWWETLDFYNTCLRRHGLSPQPSWNQAGPDRDRADFLYRGYAGPEPLYIGEKCPTYYNRLRLLARTYPQARFIIIWRNPRDTISSIFKAGKGSSFFSKRSLYIRSVLGLEKMQADALDLRRQGRAVFDLCYEDLIENQEVALRSICEFLEIPFDPVMLELGNADCSMLPPGEHHAKAKSGRVCPTVHSTEPSLQRIQPKIQRYLARWRERFQDQLDSKRYWSQAAKNAPGPIEILGDRLHYHWQCLLGERLTPFVYGLVPSGWLNRYRRARKKRDF